MELQLQARRLVEGRDLPLLVEPPEPASRDLGWIAQSRSWIDEQLRTAGALLFRGLAVDSPEAFNAFVQAFGSEALEYKERSSPRSQVLGNIYTSTDYPPGYPIHLHNENSYSHSWPMQLFFYCHQPAEEGGETPIADSRGIFQRINPLVRQRFGDRKVMYVRNFGHGLGLHWSTVFQTEDRSQVENYCTRAGISWEWLDADRLRTRHVRPAIKQHPDTGEPVWFNHAVFFHVSTLEPFMREALEASYAADELPNNTFYGDGSPIEPQVLDHVRAAYRAEKVLFSWRKGDVMVLDNMLVCHGREPFRGTRKVMVAMSRPVGDSEVPD